MTTVIDVNNLSKRYRLGVFGGKTLREDVQRWWAKARGGPDPLAKVTDEAQNVEGSFVWALRDVSFSVPQGEVLGIIGRNGAGKSTLLKLLTRITAPTEGRIRMKGRVASMLEVGTGFHPELTGRENVFLNGAILGMTKADVRFRFDEIVAFSGVEHYIGTPIKRYSSGMKVRLAFAVAAHLEPEILLIDEVLAVGDAEFQKRCLGKMKSVAGEGRTVLFVSHRMRSVERLCDRTILLKNGRLDSIGPTRDIVARYLRTGLKQQGHREWEDTSKAPGDHVVRLKSVKVLSKGQITNELKLTEAFDIEVQYWLLDDSYEPTVVIYFYDEEGTLLFLALDSQDPAWTHQERGKGICTSTCHVPADLLNEGTISITIGIATHPWSVHLAGEPDVVTFKMVDDLEPGGARGEYTKAWPGGAVRPRLDWSFAQGNGMLESGIKHDRQL